MVFIMGSAAELLVIILAIVLSVFLIVGIILTIYLIRLSAEIRHIAKTAAHAVDSVESVVSSVTKLTSPLFVAEIVGRYIKKFAKTSKKGK
jgi:accessory gene regulator protein AgrB